MVRCLYPTEQVIIQIDIAYVRIMLSFFIPNNTESKWWSNTSSKIGHFGAENSYYLIYSHSSCPVFVCIPSISQRAAKMIKAESPILNIYHKTRAFCKMG